MSSVLIVEFKLVNSPKCVSIYADRPVSRLEYYI